MYGVDMKVIYLIILVLLTVACNDDKPMRSSLSDASGGCSGETMASSETGPLFKISGETVTRKDLPAELANLVYRNEFEAYSKNQNIFKEYALRVYLAKKQDKLEDMDNPPKLMDLLDIPEPSDKEMKALFEQSRSRLPKEVTFESMKSQISGYLKSQKVAEIFQEEVKKMEADGAYQSLIAGPVAPKMEISTDGFPTTGNKDSKIKVIEIADYTCGHCQHAHPEVKEILKKYKDKISFTQINYSLRPNGQSGMYVKGGFCAHKQGEEKFWSYHDKAFAKNSEPHDHSAPGHSHGPNADEVVAVAQSAGLKAEEFKKCLQSPEAQEFMMNTNATLSAQGITGTPAFIINNQKVEGGVQTLEAEIKKLL
tara:strand:- start:2170 stop:3273 length:1104 start_codon:yes stop_codon:yes gene_type:complete